MKSQKEAVILRPKESSDLHLIRQLQENQQTQILDEIKSQVAELIKLQNPSISWTSESLFEAVEDFFRKHDQFTYGVWVFYPWKNTLVHLLPEEEFVAVRTVRNKFKITQEEQDLLSNKKIGIIGLSVGQSVAISLAMERSFGELRIADFDTLELGNMNRLRSSVVNLGIPKTTLVKREIAEIDPFMKVIIYDEGITPENMHDFFTKSGQLDLLIEECDSLEVKVQARIKARSLGIPVLMDTSDRGMVDIERFDLEKDRPLFHGLLSKLGTEEEVLELLNQRKSEVLLTLVDYEKVSTRGKSSFFEIGKTITSWPQLGSSVIMGGAMCAHFARKILIGDIVTSGRSYIDLDEFFNKRNES
ncbi:ThiF family adenylyltransferase [Belliella baltica]|uniref:ThiF family adenylyltransferase n=1 Tax=Belliella baltica TaxID=232259 RepID=UPI001FE093B4|nr:ThiF family adenylyltransferase [Belliella baltica]